MGDESKFVTAQFPSDTVEMIDNEADQLNMSRAEYIRKHVHAGRRLFQSSGKLDTQLLADLVEGNESAHLSNDLTTDAEGIEDEIRAALPADKERALSTEQIRKAVFGTVDEQREQIDRALEFLAERDQIRITVDGDKYLDE